MTLRSMEEEFVAAAHRHILQHLIDGTFWPNRKQERRRIVNTFQEIHDQWSETWIMLFQILFLINDLILGFLIYAQYTNPWGMQAHAYFKEHIDAEMVIIVEGLAAVACVMGVYAFVCHCKNQNRTLISSVSLADLVAIFWLYYMLSAPIFRWDLMWLPMTPLSCFLASAYVVYLLSESQAAINKLRASSR